MNAHEQLPESEDMVPKSLGIISGDLLEQVQKIMVESMTFEDYTKDGFELKKGDTFTQPCFPDDIEWQVDGICYELEEGQMAVVTCISGGHIIDQVIGEFRFDVGDTRLMYPGSVQYFMKYAARQAAND